MEYTVICDDPSDGAASGDFDFERYRGYLLLLARLNAGKAVHAKLEPADLVQQTLLAAHQSRRRFRGSTDAERRRWLREILACTIAQAARALGRQKRDAARERSIQADLDASSRRLEQWLADDQTSPSERVAQRELVADLSLALTKLPDQQREALVLRYCQGWTFAQIAAHLGCTPPSVLGLVQRGSQRLRRLMNECPE